MQSTTEDTSLRVSKRANKKMDKYIGRKKQEDVVLTKKSLIDDFANSLENRP